MCSSNESVVLMNTWVGLVTDCVGLVNLDFVSVGLVNTWVGLVTDCVGLVSFECVSVGLLNM
jgi:hypothetical protein